MFSKLSLLVVVAPLVSALTFGPLPPNIDSASPVTITWTTTAADPSIVTLELFNPTFNDALALANDVDTSTGSLDIILPAVVPGPGYTFEFVNIGDINQNYGQSPTFSIGPASSSSGSAPSTTSSVTSATTNTQSATGIVTTAKSLPATISTAATPSSISSPTTGTGTGTGTAAAATSSAAAVSSRFALTNAGSYAVLLLSAVAGAAAIAL